MRNFSMLAMKMKVGARNESEEGRNMRAWFWIRCEE